MTLGSLCEAAIRVSDNTAANLMMQKLGGPKVFKDCLQEIGDKTTRPVRLEPELNTRDGKRIRAPRVSSPSTCRPTRSATS